MAGIARTDRGKGERRKKQSREKKMGSRKKVGTGGDDEQVEQLLQAAQDELVLKMSVDSHMSRVSPNYIDSDLDRRFQALRSRPSSAASATRNPRPSQPPPQSDSSSRPPVTENPPVDGESQSILGDDLAARFAALKASLPSLTTPPSSLIPDDVDDDDDEDDEVEKLIRWAKDAARLDPSPPSDEDDDDEWSSSDEDVDDRRRKERQKKKAA